MGLTIAASGRAEPGPATADADLRLARLPPRWHGLEHLRPPALARMEPRGPRRDRLLAGTPPPSDSTLAAPSTVKPNVGGLLPVFVLDRYEGYEVKRVQDCNATSSTTGSRRTPAALRDHGPADLLFVNHVLLGGPVGGRQWRSLHRQGTRLRARVLDARATPSCQPGGARRWRARRRRSSAPRTSARSFATSAAWSTAFTRSRPGVDVELWKPAPRDEALDQLVAEARRDPPNPGNENERLPDEGNAEAARGVPRGRPAHRRLLREADREQGRAGAARGAARAGRRGP